jgi:energy-converting hydrogenase A subunit R
LGRKIFVTDCEGPLTLNDNAFELCKEFIPSGDKLFKILSSYDDYLVDVVKKENYNAGNTLKLIIPFLKIQNITNKEMVEFSKNNIFSLNGAKDTLSYIKKSMNSYIVSTSYGQYIEAVSNYFDFPFENTFYTSIDMDSFIISNGEIQKINKFKDIILNLDLDKTEDLHYLDKIFFEEIPKMSLNKYYSKIKTIGGSGKQIALEEIIFNEKIDKKNVFYIGDSITDVEPLKFTKENGGISVSFNGNIYALNEAEIAIISVNTLPTAIIADIFSKFDKNHLINFIKDYNNSNDLENLFKLYKIDSNISSEFFKNNEKPIIEIINENNIKNILDKSLKMRNEIRGQDIGNLG